MLNGHNQEAIKQAIHEQLDARDETTCAQFAEHCATWIDNALVLELCQVLITEADPLALIDVVSVLNVDLSITLNKFYTHIDHLRAEFLEEEAQNRLRAAEAEADARADFQAETDAESRRLLR